MSRRRRGDLDWQRSRSRTILIDNLGEYRKIEQGGSPDIAIYKWLLKFLQINAQNSLNCARPNACSEYSILSREPRTGLFLSRAPRRAFAAPHCMRFWPSGTAFRRNMGAISMIDAVGRRRIPTMLVPSGSACPPDAPPSRMLTPSRKCPGSLVVGERRAHMGISTTVCRWSIMSFYFIVKGQRLCLKTRFG